jgi:hypothetical protein
MRLALPVRTGSVHDFDFLVGAWTIDNRTLAPDGSWNTFASTSQLRQELGGVVNVDVYNFPTRGFDAMALRIFDLATRQWSIYWIEGRAGILLPPVHGGFDGDRGEFYGHDTVAGRPVLYRYLWTRLGADRARWEQAFTEDGHAWTTNWVMTFTRQ